MFLVCLVFYLFGWENLSFVTSDPFQHPVSLPDSTKITLAPANADVNVGENTRMQCAASHDSSLDFTFIWSLDGQAIDLQADSQHYERTPVRHFFSH